MAADGQLGFRNVVGEEGSVLFIVGEPRAANQPVPSKRSAAAQGFQCLAAVLCIKWENNCKAFFAEFHV